MSDQDDWELRPGRRQGEIRAGGYLLRDATGGARGDIVQEIIAIVRQVASGLRRAEQSSGRCLPAADGARRAPHEAAVVGQF